MTARWMKTATAMVQTSSAAPRIAAFGIRIRTAPVILHRTRQVPEPLADPNLVKDRHHGWIAGKLRASSRQKGGGDQDLHRPADAVHPLAWGRKTVFRCDARHVESPLGWWSNTSAPVTFVDTRYF